MISTPPEIAYREIGRVWRVPSHTTPGRRYDVRCERGRFVCPCLAGQYGRRCRHLNEVESGAVKVTVRLALAAVEKQPASAADALYERW